jgi:hypothetical protein
LTEDKKVEGRGLGESKLKIENRGSLGVSSNDIEAMERGAECEGRAKGVDYQTQRLT